MILSSIAILLILNNTQNVETIVLGGGCFWCTEAIYQNVEGVINVTPGYSGGNVPNPSYEEVCTGQTGHAEVVKIEFDPSKVDLNRILDIFFQVHDPTTLNQQSADIGTQYRSVIFYVSNEQKAKIIKKIKNIQDSSEKHIITEVSQLTNFYKAEEYHLNYFNRNKNQPYCRYVIKPKVEKFKKLFPKE